jgi:hypothetical protein
MTSPASAPTPTEIADLLAWARQLTSAGATADPAQRAAYLAAKADLLARIADARAHEHPCHADQARQVAEQARAVAAQATALLPPDKDAP